MFSRQEHLGNGTATQRSARRIDLTATHRSHPAGFHPTDSTRDRRVR
jgi:hypothetical protein